MRAASEKKGHSDDQAPIGPCGVRIRRHVPAFQYCGGLLLIRGVPIFLASKALGSAIVQSRWQKRSLSARKGRLDEMLDLGLLVCPAHGAGLLG